MDKNRSQVSLEIAMALVGAFLLIYAAFNLIVWVNSSLIRRNAEYEKTRISAAQDSQTTPLIVNETAFPKLRIMGEKD